MATPTFSFRRGSARRICVGVIRRHHTNPRFEFHTSGAKKSLCRSGIRAFAPRLICPSGTSHKIPSILSRKNIPLPVFGNQCIYPRIPARLKRGGRVVTDVEAGCDGRECIVRRAMHARTAKACGPGALVAGAKFADDDLQATVTQKPVSPGRARYKPLTPLRRECRYFGFSCSDCAGVLLIFAHWAMGAAKHPAFPAPSRFRGRPTQDSGENAPRECERMSRPQLDAPLSRGMTPRR
jgi:hypothetical protein